MKYRSELDGLRAIAVIAVMLFHAGFTTFSGGFVGVDVFFVISGYLITALILVEKSQGTFSLIHFYERRVRRILPALFLVMLVSLPFAWLWLMANDMRDFSQSLLAVITFSSNILFFHETNYWAAASELKPLVHTWSLAVEEQYYLIFPLFILLMWKYGKRWILAMLLLIAGASLALAQWGAYHQPVAAFYLLPFRIWEFVIGAGMAFCLLYPTPAIRILLANRVLAEVLGCLGLLMIAYAVFSFNKHTPFPSVYTLLPTVGAGLIILFASAQTVVGRILGIKPLVALGVVSYSAYLWHQPLFAYAKHASFDAPNQWVFAGLVVLVIPLAYLTWRFVEQPFRAKHVFTRRAIFVYALMGSSLFVIIGLTGHLTYGFNERVINSQLSAGLIEQKLQKNYGLSAKCYKEFTLSPACRTDDAPEILVWGDSYAMHLVPGILASNPDAKVIQMTKAFCGPFFDVAPVVPPVRSVPWAQECLGFTAKVREWLRQNTTVKYVVLSSPFSQYLLYGHLLYRSGEVLPATMALGLKAFERTLREIQTMGLTPVVFSPPPVNGTDLGRCLAKAEWRGLNLDNCDFGVNEMTPSKLRANKFLKKVADNHTVIFLDDLICSGAQCAAHRGNVFLYRDDGHLSHEGVTLLGQQAGFYQLIVGN